MIKQIDLRTDTSTKPTKAMRQAMYEAEVGNDRFGEDSTTNKLQELAANTVGKEAALFSPTGTMAIAMAGRVLLNPFDTVVGEINTAIFSVGFFNGIDVDFKLLTGNKGRLSPNQIEETFGGPGYLGTTPRLLVLENTFQAFGTALESSYCQQLCNLARDSGVATFLDGARIFNAARAQDTDVKDLCEPFDALMFSLTKGLGAPIGSVLLGSKEFIAEAFEIRMRLGGQMRQTGVVAAAGIIALEQMVDRLAEDHDNARLLATTIAEFPGIEIDLEIVQSNIVWFRVVASKLSASDLASRLEEHGVLGLAFPGEYVRLVTHKDVSRGDIEITIKAIKEIMIAAKE